MQLTSCEACGMQWTAQPRELCPRCELAAEKEKTARLQLCLNVLGAGIKDVNAVALKED